MTNVEADRLDAMLVALRSVAGDLSLPLLVTLVAVAQEPGLSVNELADRIQVPQQTASRYVAILQGRYAATGGSENTLTSQPLVSLQVSDSDPRRRALFLTPHGKLRLERFINELYKEAGQRT